VLTAWLFVAHYLPICCNTLSFAHNAVNLTTVSHNVMYIIVNVASVTYDMV